MAFVDNVAGLGLPAGIVAASGWEPHELPDGDTDDVGGEAGEAERLPDCWLLLEKHWLEVEHDIVSPSEDLFAACCVFCLVSVLAHRRDGCCTSAAKKKPLFF